MSSNDVSACRPSVLARQDSTGAFGLWSASASDDTWLNAFVTDFLTRAREEGFVVPQKAFDQVARLGEQELDRHAPAQLGVAGEIDDAHAATSELADELVLANAQALSQAPGRSGLGGLARTRLGGRGLGLVMHVPI